MIIFFILDFVDYSLTFLEYMVRPNDTDFNLSTTDAFNRKIGYNGLHDPRFHGWIKERAERIMRRN